MVPQIPYQEIGLGVVILLAVWSFLVAETGKERAFIVAVPASIVLVSLAFRASTGPLVRLVGLMVYGLGCIVYLRYNGIRIR
jgi:hypothetical protein